MGVRAPSNVGAGRGEGGREGAVIVLSEKKHAMPECLSVEIGVQTHSKCVKNKNVFKDSKIVILKTCILSDLYQQSQSSKSKTWKSSFFNGVRSAIG